MSEHTDLESLKEFTAGDRFNYLHRHEAGLDRHYAADLDLIIIEKHPEPHIPAFIEFKQQREPIRYTQAVLFKHLSAIAPVFVVIAETELVNTDASDHRFTVRRFCGVIDSDPTPPELAWRTVRENIPWGGKVTYDSPFDWEEHGGDGLIGWEESLRNRRFNNQQNTQDSQLADFVSATIPGAVFNN